jgi:2-iminobutanoate/2-iminopropanoate deaminase
MSIREVIHTSRAPAAIGPYVQALKCSGAMVFVSGQIPLDPETMEVVEGGIKAQAEQVFKNVLAVLEASGATAAHIVKNGIFLTDMNDFAEVNKIYAQYFGDTPPARFCVEVSRLPKDVLIEMDSIACFQQ